MAKPKLTTQLYNKLYKEAFIETIDSEKQKEQVLGLFRKTREFEEELDKDVYDMKPSELDDMLKSLRFTGFNSAIRDISIVNKYNIWAMINGHCKNMTFKEIDTKHENVKKYFYKNFNSVYSKDEILEATRQMPERLGLIAELLFHGLKGTSGLEEIRCLKVEQLKEIDGKCFVELERGDIEISKRLHDELIRYDKELYDKDSEYEYVKSEYIFKPLDRGNNRNQDVIRATIGTTVMKYFKEAINDKSVTITTLRRSGFNYYAYEYMKESGEMVLTKDILRKLAHKYKIGMNGVGFWNYNALLDWIYEDKIKESYGDFTFSDEF